MNISRPALIVVLVAAVAAGCDRAGGGALAGQALGSIEPAPILLFAGTGTSANDVRAIEAILAGRQLRYATVGSAGLDAMSEAQLRTRRLLIVPGGNFVEMGNQLAPGTTATIRRAVQNGLNYLGICGGAFIAGASPYNGLNLTGGVQFKFFSAENRGIRKAAVTISVAGAQAHDQYWEDGPELSGWGAAVATYPDGTPAVVEGAVGRGWVILTGTHPEAPESWRQGLSFATPASASHAYAATLIDAALNGTRLPHY